MKQVLRLYVDPSKCEGHNRCFSLAPELFDIDEDGYATASNDGLVPEEQAGLARTAASNCPERAITIST